MFKLKIIESNDLYKYFSVNDGLIVSVVRKDVDMCGISFPTRSRDMIIIGDERWIVINEVVNCSINDIKQIEKFVTEFLVEAFNDSDYQKTLIRGVFMNKYEVKK